MITKQTIESSNGIAVRALAQCAVSKPSQKEVITDPVLSPSPPPLKLLISD